MDRGPWARAQPADPSKRWNISRSMEGEPQGVAFFGLWILYGAHPRPQGYYYSVFLINHAGILENLGSNMAQKSVLNQLLKPFRGLGSVRNGFAMYFWSRLSPSMLRTASKWSQNQSFPLNRSGMIKEKHPVIIIFFFFFFFCMYVSQRVTHRIHLV